MQTIVQDNPFTGATTTARPGSTRTAWTGRIMSGLAVAFLIGLWVGRRQDDPGRWRWRWYVVGGYLAVTLALFAFFHPIYVADVIPLSEWQARMWFPSWV